MPWHVSTTTNNQQPTTNHQPLTKTIDDSAFWQNILMVFSYSTEYIYTEYIITLFLCDYAARDIAIATINPSPTNSPKHT
ncbi:hypothetical protein [Fischerella thermalis]|uniref:hypothetical protein n=2 Tax=Fischerella thermalis TaxID=372787 RepID=UPI0011AED678|nr:hypothetical protein [Fischerella thermalis]